MKVYNKGLRPIVYDRTRGVSVIHPRKYVDLPEETAEKVISTFPNACDEKTFFQKEGNKPTVEKKGK